MALDNTPTYHFIEMRGRSTSLRAGFLALVVGAGSIGMGSVAVARQSPGAAASLFAEGQQALERGRYEQAESVLTEAIALQSDSAAGYSLLGRAQALNRRWLRAEASLERAYELGLRDIRTLIYYGSALWEIEKFEAAEAIYGEALERNPGHPLPRYQLGRLWLWQGRYEEAVPALRESAARSPTFDVFFDLAEALRGAGEVEEAILAYQQVTRLAPDFMKARYGLAQLLQKMGRAEEAKKEFEAYMELYRLDQDMAIRQGREQGEIDRAKDLLRKNEAEEAIEHLKTLPESVETLQVLAQAYVQAGEPLLSIEALERAVVLDPGNSELRRMLSEARLAKGEAGG